MTTGRINQVTVFSLTLSIAAEAAIESMKEKALSMKLKAYSDERQNAHQVIQIAIPTC
jgi:hypothetical protein